MLLKNIKAATFCGKKILSQNNFLQIPRRNGYLILVPEIGEDLPGKYPLLKEDKSPEFTNITIEKCVAAIGKQALEFEETIRTVEKQVERTDDVTPEFLFKNVLEPIEDVYTSLNITWGIAKTLYLGNQSLMPTKYYISINERAKKATAYRYSSDSIYQACKKVLNNKESTLNDQQKGVLRKFVLEGKLNGLELTQRKKDELSDLKVLLFRDISEYSQKVEAAVHLMTFTIKDSAVVRDFPEELLRAMVSDSTKYLVGPWVLTLYPDVYELFMEYCPDRVLRWRIWEAYVTKASVLHERQVQASVALEEIRGRRMKEANYLGYKTYVDLSMETKMAGSMENVCNILDTLLATARPAQEYELKQLHAFASERGLEGGLQLWDVTFWARKLLNSQHKFKEQSLNNYFPLPKVLDGLFNLVEMLFDIKIIEDKRPDVWHKDVRFFSIFDMKESNSEPISSFYLDLYARDDEKSQNSGYMVPIQNRSKVSDMKPLAALIFSFQPPTINRPSYLSFKEVETLFRQCGHMLQHVLTKVDYADIAGHSFIEWDTAFIADYFLANWLFEPSVLQEISAHEETNEPLSLDMIKMLKHTKTHLSGYNLCKEIYWSRFDLELYSRKDFWNTILGRIWDKHFVLPPHKKDCEVCSFQTIFSGDWGAAYYSNIWSKMIAADLYSAFQDVSYKNKEQLKELGNRYRESFLSVGGTYSGRENFRKFRGRDPSPKALLKMYEIDKKSSMLEVNNQDIDVD
ncbi:probable cytosolic oligopeptidase A [Ceratina calcarata]|uniref:Probable cytosolic oligopeptidase A n=1 Tax=Ceratina calcarata TaxID=156304 RepID=A0AAJ7N6A1_9HYME|nr:probable cytosolic oligopeptidase A [Ceratina calcarata]